MKKFMILVLAMSLLWGMAGAEKLNYERLFNGDQKVQGFWVADDANLEFGDDLDMTMLYDETTNDRFELTMTSGGMYFDVTDITFYTDDATNESLTFAGFVPAFGAGIAIPDDMSATFGDDSDATITYDETTDNELEIACSNGISVESSTTFDSTVGISDDLTMAANKNITMSGTATITGVTGTYSGTVQGEQITSTDDALIYDDLTCNDIIVNATVDIGGNADIDGNTDLDLLNVSETLDVDGAATFDAVTIAEGIYTPVTAVNASTYDILATDYMIGVTYSQYGTCALDFKTTQIVDGRTIHIFDSGGNSSGYTITVSTEGSEKINGADTATITSDYGSLSLICDGTNLFTF